MATATSLDTRTSGADAPINVSLDDDGAPAAAIEEARRRSPLSFLPEP